MTLPSLSPRQLKLSEALRDRMKGHDLNDMSSVMLQILAVELNNLAELEPHIAQRNAHRFGKMLVGAVGAPDAKVHDLPADERLLELLLDPAAVLVNWLRGNINLASVIERLRSEGTIPPAQNHIKVDGPYSTREELEDALALERGSLATPPNPRPAWMPDLDGKYKCDGCGTVLHHNGHCDCTWNRRLMPIDEGENPAPENHMPGRETPEYAAALAAFTEYFVRNYPGPDTIIHNPNWHAPKLFAAAAKAIQEARSA